MDGQILPYLFFLSCLQGDRHNLSATTMMLTSKICNSQMTAQK
jgi:hypothetical protein